MHKVNARSKISHVLPQILTLNEIDQMYDKRMKTGRPFTYVSLSVCLAQ